MRGRRPKPAKQKALAGNPGRRQLPTNEPEPAVGEPPRPAWMKGEAAKEWDRVTAILRAEKRLTLSDAPALEKLCAVHARWMRLRAKADHPRTPLTVPTAEGGEKPHPVFNMERAAADQCRHFYAEFGLTPSARPRTRTAAPVGGPQETPADTMRLFLVQQSRGQRA